MTFRTYSGHHEHLSGNDVDEMAGFLFLFGTDTNAHDDSNGDKLYPGHAKWIAGRRLKGYRWQEFLSVSNIAIRWTNDECVDEPLHDSRTT